MCARFARRLLFAVLFVGGVSVFVWAITFSSSYQTCVAKEHDRQTSQSEQGTFASIGILIRCEAVPLDKHAGALTAIGTFVIAFFTLTLWAVTNNALRLARDEFNATHRPDIIVHNFEVSRDILHKGTAIGAQFIVVNKGTTEATILDIAGRIFMTDHLRPGSAMPSIGYTGHRLAGGEPIRDVAIFGTTADTEAADFNSGFSTKSVAGGAKLWCIGRIAYADSKGRTRETGFCRSYEAEGKRWVREPESDYEYAY